MARINLLPWREERRQAQKKEFFFMLGGVAIGAGALFMAVTFFVNNRIEYQQERNKRLTTEISKLDARIKKIETLEQTRRQLLARKEIIEQLQANRSQMVHLFDELVKTLPEGVRLASIKQQGNTLTLEGDAQSNSRVSSYMRMLAQSPWLRDPDLNVIRANEKALDYRSQFSLKVKLTRPGADENNEGLTEEEFAS